MRQTRHENGNNDRIDYIATDSIGEAKDKHQQTAINTRHSRLNCVLLSFAQHSRTKYMLNIQRDLGRYWQAENFIHILI